MTADVYNALCLTVNSGVLGVDAKKRIGQLLPRPSSEVDWPRQPSRVHARMHVIAEHRPDLELTFIFRPEHILVDLHETLLVHDRLVESIVPALVCSSACFATAAMSLGSGVLPAS